MPEEDGVIAPSPGAEDSPQQPESAPDVLAGDEGAEEQEPQQEEQAIPYNRFKEVNDEKNTLRSQASSPNIAARFCCSTSGMYWKLRMNGLIFPERIALRVSL